MISHLVAVFAELSGGRNFLVKLRHESELRQLTANELASLLAATLSRINFLSMEDW